MTLVSLKIGMAGEPSAWLVQLEDGWWLAPWREANSTRRGRTFVRLWAYRFETFQRAQEALWRAQKGRHYPDAGIERYVIDARRQ